MAHYKQYTGRQEAKMAGLPGSGSNCGYRFGSDNFGGIDLWTPEQKKTHRLAFLAFGAYALYAAHKQARTGKKY